MNGVDTMKILARTIEIKSGIIPRNAIRKEPIPARVNPTVQWWKPGYVFLTME
jgi:hypothetical protein